MPVGYGNHDIPAHQRSLYMCICIVLERVMLILAVWFLRRKLLKPHLKVVVKTCFIIVNKNTGSDVHRVDQNQTFLYSALLKAFLNLAGYVYKCSPRGNLK